MNASVCYRHPDREAFVRCQRCDRTICPDCQIEASVGFLCPDDARTGARNRTRAMVTQSGAPVTTLIVALSTVIWLLQILPGSPVTNLLAFNPLWTLFEPWRLVTSAFVHDTGNILHLLLNMYSVFIFGRIIEPLLGRWRYLALYLISAVGGSIMVLILSPLNTWVVGASTSCFGLMAAYFVIARKYGANTGQLVGLVAINLAFGFLVPGISWQGHLGGLVAGGLVAFIFTQTSNVRNRLAQPFAIGGFVVVLAVLAAAVAYLRMFYLG